MIGNCQWKASAATGLLALFAITIVCSQPGAAQDIDKLRLDAEQGSAEAQFNLGSMYETGEGVLQDSREAVRWYRSAALQGHAMARYNLGTQYYRGEGVSKDRQEAVRWFHLAADQGHARAQRILGLLYDFGEGVPEDDVRAYAWFNVAAIEDSASREMRDELRAEMTGAQIVEAQRLSAALLGRIESADSQ